MINRQTTILMDLKGELLQIFNDVQPEDEEQFEYLLQYIDYFLLNRVPINKLTVSAFLEEVISTSIYAMTPRLLSCVKQIQRLLEVVDYATAN